MTTRIEAPAFDLDAYLLNELLPSLDEAEFGGLMTDLEAEIHVIVQAASAPAHWEDWLDTMFPAAFIDPHALHHEEYWAWLWSIRAGVRPRPYVLILSRGGGKTTCVEVAPIALGAKNLRRYAWYIQATQSQADKRISNIAEKLEGKTFGEYYPDMSERYIGKFGNPGGWRRSFVRTRSDFVVEAVGLDKAVRSSKVGDARPDLIIIDDVDSFHDSPAVVERKIDTLTNTILPAAAADAVIIFIQNLMHPNSIAAKLVGEADFLVDRIVSGPYPALTDFEYEIRYDEQIGRNRAMITHGYPTWAGQDVERCQVYIDTFTLRSFRSECQHEVDEQLGGVWDDIPFIRCRFNEVPDLVAGCVWVDPAVTEKDESDSHGIQADGIDEAGYIYRFKSYERRTSPEKSLKRATLWALELGFETVGVETDQGGDAWESVYKQACQDIKHDADKPQYNAATRFPKLVQAKAGAGHGSKVYRNSLMLADYEMGMVVHVLGLHQILERGLLRFPKFKPFDLADVAYYSWDWLRNKKYVGKVAKAR